MTGWSYLAIFTALFVGVTVGILVAGLANAAHRSDEFMKGWRAAKAAPDSSDPFDQFFKEDDQ